MGVNGTRIGDVLEVGLSLDGVFCAGFEPVEAGCFVFVFCFASGGHRRGEQGRVFLIACVAEYGGVVLGHALCLVQYEFEDLL